jgi:hypothetical protein
VFITIFTVVKIKIKELRKFIREEVERNMRFSAGFFSGGIGAASIHHGAGSSDETVPPPGLGPDTEEIDKEILDKNYGEQEKSQASARVYDRTGGAISIPRKK